MLKLMTFSAGEPGVANAVARNGEMSGQTSCAFQTAAARLNTTHVRRRTLREIAASKAATAAHCGAIGARMVAFGMIGQNSGTAVTATTESTPRASNIAPKR